MDKIIALDIGGTSIKYGLVNSMGEIICKTKRDSNAQKGALHLLDNVKAAIRELVQSSSSDGILGVGIATTGQIDHITGKVLFATPTIPNYSGMNIKKIMEAEFGFKTFVENDVNAATIGEVWKGAGIGGRKVIGITIGTGIGGCIMFDGTVEHGILGSAGEVGHIIIEYNGRQCNCGNKGCFEQYASSSALIRDFSERIKRGETSSVTGIISKEEEINAQLIFEAARKGDKLASSVLKMFIEYLGTGLISLIHVLNPELIIIGGGISNEGEYLSKKIEDYVNKRIMSSFARNLRIKTASLGNDAGMVGAAKIALDGLDFNK